VESLLDQSKAVYLTGDEQTGKTAVLAEIAKKRRPERVFYFSPLFAKQPVAYSFRSDLRQVAEGVGIDTLSIRSWPELYAAILAEGVTILLDDVFIPRIKSTQLQTEIVTLLGIQEDLGSGSLVLASEVEPRNLTGFENRFRNLEIVQIERALENEWRRAYRDAITRWFADADPDTQAVAKVLSHLRSAVDIHLARKLSGVASARLVLESIDKQGFLDIRGAQCHLRHAVWAHARKSLGVNPEWLRGFARQVCKVANQSHQTDVLHFGLESESIYWEAGDFEHTLGVALTLARN
jgi:hypothetical protein